LKYFISALIGLVVLCGFYFFGNRHIDQHRPGQSVYVNSSLPQQPFVTNGLRQPDISSGMRTGNGRPEKPTGNEIFERYRQGGQHGYAGRMMLDEVDVLGIDKTAKNFKLVSDLLKSHTSNEEKEVLAKILASFYSREDANGWNSQVLDDLRQLTHSGNKELARAAILSFSRLGYFPDSESLLLAAKNSKYITDRDYYRELSYVLLLAPAANQKLIADTIKAGGNSLSAEIFSSMLQDKDSVKIMSPEALAIIKAFIFEHEPKFSQAPDEFGLVDAVRYGEWLNAVAVLRGGNDSRHVDSVLMEHLSNVNTDPRKMISYLMTSDADRFISNVGSSEAFRKMQQRIDVYAAQNAENSAIRDVVLMIREKIKKAS
jgi:hypothetical protein